MITPSTMLITLRFYRPSTWWGWLVSIGGRRLRFVHVDAIWNLHDNIHAVTDSAPLTGVRLQIVKDQAQLADVESITLMLPASVPTWVLDQVGVPYGLADCAQAFVRRWTGLTIGGNPRGMECAEYIAQLLRAHGVDLPEMKSPTPDDLLAAIHRAPPTMPKNGDTWTTARGMFAHINGVTVPISGIDQIDSAHPL